MDACSRCGGESRRCLGGAASGALPQPLVKNSLEAEDAVEQQNAP